MSRFVLLVLAFLLLIFWLDPYAPTVSLSAVSRLAGPDPIVLTQVPYRPGERVRFECWATMDLSATVAFANQPLRYDLKEEEVLELSVLDGDPADARLAFPRRRQTTVAPLIGRKVRERRVEGHAYLVSAGAGGPTILAGDGSPAPEKEARYVRWAWDVVGGAPALHAIVPPAGVQPGQTLTVEGEPAKRLLGLGMEEVVAERLELTVVGPAEGGLLVFDARARLTGSAEVGGQVLSLNAELSGRLVADTATARLVSIDLSGEAQVASDGGEDDAWQASGSGPLTIHRSVSALAAD